MTKKPRLGQDPFSEPGPLTFIRDTRQEKPEKTGKLSNTGKPDNTDKPIKPGNIHQAAKKWKRATFIVRENHLEKITALAYWERASKTKVLDQALESYFKGKQIKPIPTIKEV